MEPPLHSEIAGRLPATLEKRIPINYFCKGSNASAKALPICAKIFALPK